MRAKLLIIAVRHIEAHNSGFHQRRRCADGIEVVILFDAVHNGLRCDSVAETPAGNGIGLGQARTADRPLPHARQTVHVDMLVSIIDDMLVDLVHDGKRIILDAEFRNQFQFVVGEDFAGWIRRIADQNGLRALLESVFQHICIEVEFWRYQRYEDRFTVRHNSLRAVIFKIRGEHDDLVARIGQGKDCIDHGFCRADGYDHIGIRVECASHEAPSFAGQCLTEVRCAHRDGVLVRA